MIKLVIFDLDGTLLNTIDDLAAAGNHVCAAHGWPTHTSEQFRYFVGDGVYKLIERMTPAGAAETPETVQCLRFVRTDPLNMPLTEPTPCFK